MDDRKRSRPDLKYNDWEMRGVPFGLRWTQGSGKRLGHARRRDVRVEMAKTNASQSALGTTVNNLLSRFNHPLARALLSGCQHHEPKTDDELKQLSRWLGFSWWLKVKM